MEMQIHSRQIKHLYTLNFYYILLIYLFNIPQHTCGSQRASYSCHFPPSTMWDPWPIGLEAGAFPIEPSCQSH